MGNNSSSQYPGGESPISILPPELLLMIFHFLWDRGSFSVSGDRHVRLSRCSKVCREWRPIAQEILFSEAQLHYEAKAQLFLAAIRSNPSLGRATRQLHLCDVTVPVIRHLPPVLPQTTYDITSLCPHLYELRMEIIYCPVRQPLESVLPPHTFATLRAFSVHLVSGRAAMTEFPARRMNVQDFLLFLRRFRALSHLHMHNVGRLDQPNIPITTLPPPSFQLLELGWSLDYIRNNPYPTRFFLVTVEWLLRNSSKDIRILYFDDRYAAFKTDDLYLFLKAHGANLVSLRLFGSEGDIINLRFQLGMMCPNLHELILPEVHALPTELRSTLPESTLEHLCFEAPVDERKVVMETIEWTMSLPKLRFITFDNPRKVYWAEKWRERCTGQVHVEWSSHRHEFKYEDLIWKSKFPRGRTIENIQRMVT